MTYSTADDIPTAAARRVYAALSSLADGSGIAAASYDQIRQTAG